MLKISGLPVEVTKADLDEIFAPYGTIQTADESVVIEVGECESTAYLTLDKNEPEAIAQLRNTTWRDDYVLYLDPVRGDGRRAGQPGSGKKLTTGTGNPDDTLGDGILPGQPGSDVPKTKRRGNTSPE